MATTNVTVTTTWTKVADDTDDPVCISSNSATDWEWACVGTDTAPSVSGHLMTMGQGATGGPLGITRSQAITGFIYARMIDSGSSAVFAKTV
jgi:hypothetical protein